MLAIQPKPGSEIHSAAANSEEMQVSLGIGLNVDAREWFLGTRQLLTESGLSGGSSVNDYGANSEISTQSELVGGL
jgi:hypothetical protein